MSSPVLVVKPTNPVAHAKNLMLRHKIKHLLVLDKGEAAGMLSMRDIIGRISCCSSTRRGRPVDGLSVARVMRRGVITVSAGTELSKTASLMLKHGVGSVLVQKGKNIAGIVTKTDMVRVFSESLAGRIKVEDLMSTDVITVGRGRSFARLTKLMKKHGVGQIVVTEGEKPVGTVTESDITFAKLDGPVYGTKERKVKYTRRLERGGRPRARYVKRITFTPVEGVMSSRVLTVNADGDAARAAALMVEHDISGVPVLKEGKLAGIITKTGLVRGISSLGV